MGVNNMQQDMVIIYTQQLVILLSFPLAGLSLLRQSYDFFRILLTFIKNEYNQYLYCSLILYICFNYQKRYQMKPKYFTFTIQYILHLTLNISSKQFILRLHPLRIQLLLSMSIISSLTLRSVFLPVEIALLIDC